MIRLNYVNPSYGAVTFNSAGLDELCREYGFQASRARGYRNTHWLAVL